MHNTYTVTTNTGAQYTVRAASENAAWRAALRRLAQHAPTVYVVRVAYHHAPEGACNA